MRSKCRLLLVVVGCFVLPAAVPAQDRETKELVKKLDGKISLDKGIDANTPLSDALAFVADKFGISITIDTKAFEKANVLNVEEQPVGLKPVKDMALGKVLQKMLDGVTATYKTEKGKVVVVPKAKK
jgi:hypothetical protein